MAVPTPPSSPHARLARIAATGADALAAVDPVFGEHRLQVAADRFVDRAGEALAAIARAADPSHLGGDRDHGEQGRGIPGGRGRW